MTTAAPSFWSTFAAALSAEVTKAKTAIESLISNFTPLVEAGAEEVASAALTSVLQQAPLVLTGAEKLSAATSNVVSTLAASGKSVGINLAEAAVQSAYSAVAATKTSV